MNTALNQIDIPLNKLVLWDGNVRKTGIEAGLDELAASISTHGLLNPLLVRKGPKGRYAIVAGQRRYLAMQRLAKAGTMEKAAPVSCHLRSDDQDDAELSLAENVVRIAMHPADQFDAWRGLIDGGASVPDIAARFGVAESTVRKRLALARVSPALLAQYRDGAISLEALQAFTITDDHALQDSVWKGLSQWQRDDASAIREALTETDVPRRDRRVCFVGLEAYEAAGGAVRRDLFDAEGGGYVKDAALLDTLTRRKLEAVADQVRAEGWKWVETRIAFGWEERQDFQHGRKAEIALPDAVQAEADALEIEREALRGDDFDNEDDEAKACDRIEAIESRLGDIDDLTRVWTDEVMACAGAIVHLTHDGTPDIERGLIRKGDAAALQRGDEHGATVEDGSAGTKAPGQALPAALVEDLTAQKTAALRIELARSPDVALAAVVHAIATSAFYHSSGSALKLSLTTRGLQRSIKEHESCRAMLALDVERDRIIALLPEDQADLWDWCLKALRDDLLDVLAVAAAHSIDAVESKADANRSGRAQGEALAAALGLDMADWYRPTAAGYFARISKDAILTDLEQARQTPCAPAWFKMKKGELAVLAERDTAERGWLPALLR
ncbi:ParB/RepB/Spo0J family partition protein [Mesorhizobium sophorae]|uniref:ParB/RepB/Spo0J family partition protein n=1 Tax=Mesorhizobium sophorae TaxID=1300294 RepID=UPI000BA3ED76|nr:ParB N-terminal domain-containing protein [Mesorhizobium sophorae]